MVCADITEREREIEEPIKSKNQGRGIGGGLRKMKNLRKAS